MSLRFQPVFMPAGAAALIIALVILIRSLIARNSYEILLSCIALLLLFVLGITGIWKSRKLKSMESGWKPPFPMTANAGEDSLISRLEERLPLFFRLHFVVRGRFYPAGSLKGCPVFAETSVSRGKSTARLSFDFPMSGVFQGEGFCTLRDIFGFFSFTCGVTQSRTIKVRSSPCFGKNYHINPQSGAEDRRNKTSSNEERYYMREYTPGDRFRDINWKSSEKIDTFITRISPDNQEKVSRIEVYFRNYGPVDTGNRERGRKQRENRGRKKRQKVSLEALWLLDRAKARLSYFLRSLMEQHSSYVFHVRAAGGSWEIEDSEDLDAFLEELAGLSFSSAQNEIAVQQGAGDLYVFSTACDIGLPGFLVACNPRPVSVCLIQPGISTANLYPREPSQTIEKKQTIGSFGSWLKKIFIYSNEKNLEILSVKDFPAKGCIPSLRWLFGSKINQLGVHANRVENIYAEVKF